MEIHSLVPLYLPTRCPIPHVCTLHVYVADDLLHHKLEHRVMGNSRDYVISAEGGRGNEGNIVYPKRIYISFYHNIVISCAIYS